MDSNLLGVSGGVDSTVAALLFQNAIGEQLQSSMFQPPTKCPRLYKFLADVAGPPISEGPPRVYLLLCIFSRSCSSCKTS